MSEHRDRDDDSHLMGRLKSQTDGNAVQQTVQAEHAGGKAATRRGVAVKQQNPIQHQVEQEAEGGPR